MSVNRCRAMFSPLSLLLFVSMAVSLSAADDLGVAPRGVVSLNGTWQCEPGTADAQPAQWSRTVPVPGLVDLCEPSLKWEAHDYFWYRKTFRLPSGQGWKRALIRIEQSQFGSEVWLNGRKMGCYDGCYTSHEYDATDAMDRAGENTLLVRVGKKNTLPPGNASGVDSEKMSFIPGIWGDVTLILTGDPRIRLVRVTPHMDEKIAEATVRIELNSGGARDVNVSAVVLEKKTGVRASQAIEQQVTIEPGRPKESVLRLPLPTMRAWSPDDPFLYELEVNLKSGDGETDRVKTTFGMRSFEVRGSDFFLNGKRVFLRGSNLAFHRFLSDPSRQNLPWDMDWVKKVMGEIPRQNNFNYFRFHLGHAYNRWYDFADEYGLLIQDEWMSFGRLHADEQVVWEEFTRWIEDNYNHPSIVIWDPVNEPQENEEWLAEARMLRARIVPAMKKLDPTRPWEFIDFEEEHPYIYSLGPVLNDDRFGFARSIKDMQESRTPTLLNEFLWFWLEHDGTPSSFTDDVILRWMGPGATAPEYLDYQAFLATELTEQFRRMRVDGIAPFTYVGANDGPTADWFLGDLREARPKPVVAALKNAFAPFGVSLELWDRHFFVNEERRINVYVFNDSQELREGRIRCGIFKDGAVVTQHEQSVTVEAAGMKVLPVAWTFPGELGRYQLRAELFAEAGAAPVAFSEKVAFVFEETKTSDAWRSRRVVVLDPRGEIAGFLKKKGVDLVAFEKAKLRPNDVLVLGEGALGGDAYNRRFAEIDDWVKRGGALIVVEPTFRVAEKAEARLPGDMRLGMKKRENTGRGGYDSCVFPDDETDALWIGIEREYLKLFNGGFGGVMVSDHDVMVNRPTRILARSGNNLNHAVLLEAPVGQGVVVISQIQTRGRLLPAAAPDSLYSRRVDPVAQRYLLNLLGAYADGRDAQALLFTNKATASSGEAGNFGAAMAVDGNPDTRWGSGYADPQWIVLNLGSPRPVDGVTLRWEAAYGKEYEILTSMDGRNWTVVYHEKNGDGDVDELHFAPTTARYVCLVGLQRGTGWGYSLWEMSVHSR